MHDSKATATAIERRDTDPDWDHAFAGVVADLQSRRAAREGKRTGASLRCVSSGYLDDGCSCDASAPFGVVSAAWRRLLAGGDGRGERFFHFSWRNEVWLAYGLSDGSVRGVYCPLHSAERDERAFAAGFSREEPSRALSAGA